VVTGKCEECAKRQANSARCQLCSVASWPEVFSSRSWVSPCSLHCPKDQPAADPECCARSSCRPVRPSARPLSPAVFWEVEVAVRGHLCRSSLERKRVTPASRLRQQRRQVSLSYPRPLADAGADRLLGQSCQYHGAEAGVAARAACTMFAQWEPSASPVRQYSSRSGTDWMITKTRPRTTTRESNLERALECTSSIGEARFWSGGEE